MVAPQPAFGHPPMGEEVCMREFVTIFRNPKYEVFNEITRVRLQASEWAPWEPDLYGSGGQDSFSSSVGAASTPYAINEVAPAELRIFLENSVIYEYSDPTGAQRHPHFFTLCNITLRVRINAPSES